MHMKPECMCFFFQHLHCVKLNIRDHFSKAYLLNKKPKGICFLAKLLPYKLRGAINSIFFCM